MKVKNLNFVEKFIEKIIIGLALVFALAVIWLKFLGQPYTVEIGGKEVKPHEVEQTILDALKKLDRGIKSTDSPIPDRKIPQFTREFVTRLQRDPSTFPFKLSLGVGGLDPRSIEIPDVNGFDFFYIPEVPKVTDVKAKQGFGVLAEVRDGDELRQFERLIGARRPRDFRWVSVSGKFDLGEWRKRLLAKPDEQGWQPLPEQFWRFKLAVTDVVIERQRWDQATGAEAEIELVEPLPNNELPWRTPPAVWPPAEAVQTIRRIRENQREVARAPFPQLDVGSWNRPDVNLADLNAEQRQQFDTLQNQINRLQERIHKLEAEAEKAALAAREAAAAAAAEGGATDAPNTPPTARRTPGGRTTAEKTDEPKETIPGLRKDLRDLEHDMETLLGGGDMLFESAEAQAADAPPSKPLEEMTPEERQRAEEEAELARIPRIVTVWAHDLTALPGEIYRYRIGVKVVSPLFKEGGNAVPKEQRIKFQEKLEIEGTFSEWTEWVPIEPALASYFPSANEQNNTAEAEIFTIFNGQRLARTFTHQPGQTIGGMVDVPFGNFGEQRRVDMRQDLILVDIDFKWPAPGSLDKTTARIVLVNTKTGQLFYKVVSEERVDPTRLRMREEAAKQVAAGN